MRGLSLLGLVYGPVCMVEVCVVWGYGLAPEQSFIDLFSFLPFQLIEMHVWSTACAVVLPFCTVLCICSLSVYMYVSLYVCVCMCT